VGESSDSSPNVFRTSITPPKPKVKRNAPIEAPPDVRITSVLPGGKGASVTIIMQEFEARSSALRASSLSFEAQASKSARVRYSIEIKNTASRKRITRVTSRNTATIRKLAPGRYTVRYRVSKTLGKKTTKTQFSPTTSLEIT
jgi:hypothetical protein